MKKEGCTIVLREPVASQVRRVAAQTGRAMNNVVDQMWLDGQVVYIDPEFFSTLVGHTNRLEIQIGKAVRALNVGRHPEKELIEALLATCDRLNETLCRVCTGQLPVYRRVKTTEVPDAGPVFEQLAAEAS